MSPYLFSQTIGITDFMRLNPYVNLNNPAYFVPYNGYVGIPGISNINFNFYNSSFRYKNLFKLDYYGKPTTFTPNKFVNSLHPEKNWFNIETNFELLGFGFRVDKYFFSVSYRLRFEESFRYSRDLFGFFVQGNLAKNEKGEYLFTKESPAVLELAPNINIYQEIALGFQGQITDKLYIGARPKILFGIINLQTKKFHAKLFSNPDDYTIYANYDVDMRFASAVPFYKKDAQGNISLNTGSIGSVSGLLNNIFSNNLGFAIDLGAVYRINQQIRVSAAVTDLGFIRWKGSPLRMTANPLADGKEYFEFSGFTTDQVLDFLRDGVSFFNLDTILNTVENSFALDEIKAYNTMLTSKVMVDGYFDLTPSNRFILQFKGYILGKAFIPQFTVAYNGTFFNAIDVVVSYSMMRKSFSNVGLGLGFRMGPVHLYTGTDNVLAAINILNTSKANFTFGLLIDFPFKAKVKEPELTTKL